MVWIIAAHIIALVQLVQCGYITVDITTDEFDLTKCSHAEVFGIIHEIAANAIPRLEVQGHRYLGPKAIFFTIWPFFERFSQIDP